jgi:Tol biopolymer transport system component
MGLGRTAWSQERAPGLVLRQITSDGKSSTDRGTGFAPAGDHISFYKQVSKSDRQLWLASGDGSQAQAISPVGWPMICGWSPDGKKLAYIFANKNEEKSEAAVCVYDLASSETKKTTGGYRRGDFGAGGDAPPIWAPDSRHFSYHINDRNRDAQFPVIFPVDGSVPVTLAANLAGTETFDSQGSWSPDGTRIVFSAHPAKGAQPEIWVSDIDGTGLKQLTDDRRDCGEPKWSPDGEWIVFFSAKDRYPDEVRNGWCWDILVMRPDGQEEQTLISGRSQSTEGRGTFVHPSWSPDGSFIICHGVQQDASGRGYQGTFFIDWKSRQWRRIMGTQMGSREHSDQHDWTISPDSKKVLRHGITYVVRGAGNEQETDPGDDFAVYDVRTGMAARLLYYRRQKDPIYLRDDASSWAPDSRRILLCQSKVISWEKEEYEPDLYLLEVPEAGIAPAPSAPAEAAVPAPETPAEPEAAAPGPEAPAPAAPAARQYALIQPANMTAQQALDSLPAADRANVIVNAERNLLIVSGPPETAQLIRGYLKSIDTPAPQVTMDVLVTEMSKTASRDLGLDWTYAKGHLGGRLPIGELGPGQVFYQGVERLDERFFAALNALEESGAVTIRANPRLTAVSGKTATMNIRRTKYYFYTQGYDQFGRPIIQQSDISADIGGKITPRVLGEGNLQVDVDVMVGNFTFTATSSLPDVTARQATTSVVLKDGETIVIGGLVLKQETRATSKTPVLGDLPLLGQLFRSSHRRVEENVLTILITPHLGARPGAESAKTPLGQSGGAQ